MKLIMLGAHLPLGLHRQSRQSAQLHLMATNGTMYMLTQYNTDSNYDI